MRRLWLACAAFACTVGQGTRALADDKSDVTKAARPSPSSIELAVSTGPSVVFREVAAPSSMSSLRRVGVFGEIGVAYRSRYFLAPFLAVGYATLASAESVVPNGAWGAGGTLEQHLGAWIFSPGVTADLWRFRPRYGIGFAAVVQRFAFNGDERSSTQFPLAHQFGLGFLMLDAGRFRLDLESRLIIASGADVTFVTLDLVARGDALRFGAAGH